MNNNGQADMRVLRKLNIRYNADMNVNMIDLMSFYSNPKVRPQGFDMSFLEALDALPTIDDARRVAELLRQAYETRVGDGMLHYYLHNLPHQNHANFAATLRWLSERVTAYIDGEIDDLVGDQGMISGYSSEFMNIFSRQLIPPVPPPHAAPALRVFAPGA